MRLRVLGPLRIVIDATVLIVAFVAAFLIRFDGEIPAAMLARLFLTGPYVVGFEYGVLVAFGVHRFAWRYVGLREASRILVATASAFAALLFLRILSELLTPAIAPLHHGLIPMGVLVVNFALGFLGIAGVRVARRLLGERADAGRRRRTGKPTVRTVLVGAGQEGVLVAREIEQRPDLGFTAVGFLDDDPEKIGTTIHGLPVLGDTASIKDICSKVRAGQALITMSNVPGSVIRRIKKVSEDAKVKVKIIPGVGDIVGGRVNLSRMRDVNIEDVLRRDPVALDMASISADVAGRTVMVTGAGGSIGSELCRQLCRFAPRA